MNKANTLQNQNDGGITLIRIAGVLGRTGIKRSTLWQWVKLGKFPKPYKLGLKAIAWSSSDIDTWIASKIKAV